MNLLLIALLAALNGWTSEAPRVLEVEEISAVSDFQVHNDGTKLYFTGTFHGGVHYMLQESPDLQYWTDHPIGPYSPTTTLRAAAYLGWANIPKGKARYYRSKASAVPFGKPVATPKELD